MRKLMEASTATGLSLNLEISKTTTALDQIRQKQVELRSKKVGCRKVLSEARRVFRIEVGNGSMVFASLREAELGSLDLKEDRNSLEGVHERESEQILEEMNEFTKERYPMNDSIQELISTFSDVQIVCHETEDLDAEAVEHEKEMEKYESNILEKATGQVTKGSRVADIALKEAKTLCGYYIIF